MAKPRKCKCKRALVKSPMNPRVHICDECWSRKENCTCKPLTAAEEADYWKGEI